MRARTEASQARAWAVTTPRRWRSSHRLAWKRLSRMPSPVVVEEGPGLGDELGQLPELGAVEGEVGPRGEDEVRLFLGQGHEEIGEGDVLAVDGDGDRQVEPVVVARGDPPEAHQGGVDHLAVVGDRADLFDLQAVDGGQRRGAVR